MRLYCSRIEERARRSIMGGRELVLLRPNKTMLLLPCKTSRSRKAMSSAYTRAPAISSISACVRTMSRRSASICLSMLSCVCRSAMLRRVSTYTSSERALLYMVAFMSVHIAGEHDLERVRGILNCVGTLFGAKAWLRQKYIQTKIYTWLFICSKIKYLICIGMFFRNNT